MPPAPEGHLAFVCSKSPALTRTLQWHPRTCTNSSTVPGSENCCRRTTIEMTLADYKQSSPELFAKGQEKGQFKGSGPADLSRVFWAAMHGSVALELTN